MLGPIVREPHRSSVLSTNLASIPGLISFNETADFLDGHYQPIPNFRSAIEEPSRNLIISLLSSSVSQIASANTTCYEETFNTVWVDTPWILWLPYGLAILANVSRLLLGGLAVFANDWDIYDNSFSTILHMTRNWEVGGPPLNHDLGRTKVRLG